MGKHHSLKKIATSPVVLADRKGVITYVNQCFQDAFGWTAEVVGYSLTRIIPAHFHDSHNMGFSRFLVTGRSRIAEHPMEAPVRRGDGETAMAEHLILVEKVDGEWVVGARLRPLQRTKAKRAPMLIPASLVPEALDEIRTTMGKMEIALGEVADAIVWTDQHGIVNWCNSAFDRMTDTPHMDIIGSRLADILPLKRAGRRVGPDRYPVARALGNDCSHNEYTLDREGREVVLEINGAPFAPTAAERYVIIAMRDVTQRKLMEETLRTSRRRMADELKVAHDIQMSLLPRRFPQRPEIDLYATIQPAREVGGDFYDFYFINPSHVFVGVGDVSGKGVPAALFTAMTKTLVRNRVQGQTRTADVVQRANRIMCADNPSHMFLSLFIAVLDIHTGRLTYTNAGHNPPLLKRADGRLRKLDDRNGPVMGAAATSRYTESTLTLQAGDTLVVYTDGVTEAADATQRLFSEMRLKHLLSEAGDLSSKALVRSVLEAVKTFQEGATPSDDMTLLALRYRGNALNYDI